MESPINTSARIVLSGTPGLVIEGNGNLNLDEEALSEEMSRLHQHNVKTLIALIEDEEIHPIAFEDIAEVAEVFGLHSVRLPIADFQATTAEQEPHWKEIRDHAWQVLDVGDSIAFYCLAGIG
ncbi:MAG: hypothetical protein QNJ43_24430 [Breoghania sp.]|nr:hypothetical protein [Breoghania sp.]